MINENVLEKLEYHKILAKISENCYSESAQQLLLGSNPYSDFATAKHALNETESALYILTKLNLSPSFRVEDIHKHTENAKRGIVLSIDELYGVLQFCKLSVRLSAQLGKIEDVMASPIVQKIIGFSKFDRLEGILSKALKNQFELNDDATSALFSIRQGIIKTKQKINAKLKKYISDESYKQYLQDDIISQRDSRYVIPVKIEHRDKIGGIVHDRSNTGATLFIEPLDVLEMNNELRELELKERLEIENILMTLTRFTASLEGDIESTFVAIVTLDVIFAKAQYAKSQNAIAPDYNNTGLTEIRGGRHPLLKIEKAVPNDIILGKSRKILLISGPNAGGKTVALKTCGLLTLLAMSGIFPTATDKCNLSFFDNIFVDIGDSQSIENSLSTFSSHITNLANITDNLTTHSLVLLDELGGGTEPHEGSALAIAITAYIARIGAKGIITTHYNNLKAYCEINSLVENASMDYDKITMKPCYKLLLGTAGSSIALDIAESYGVKKEIIDEAKDNLSEENINYNKAIAIVEQKNRELTLLLERNREIAQKQEALARELERKNEMLGEKLSNISRTANILIKEKVQKYSSEAEDIIDELKELLKEQDEGNIVKMSHVKKRLARELDMEDTDNSINLEFLEGEIEVGDTVYSQKMNCICKVLSINGKKTTLSNGNIIITGTLDDLKKARKIADTERKNKSREEKRPQVEEMREAVSSEILLLGFQKLEAIELLAEYLDKAKLYGYKTVRVVHGKGTYALRGACREFLSKSPLVSEYRNGNYGEGDNGVTVVTFK